MPTTASTDKQKAHELIDQLAPEHLSTVVGLLQFLMLDPVQRSIVAAPVDDEPVTEEDIQRIQESREAQARGEKGIPMEEVLAEFGLTPDDFPLDK